MRFALFCLLLMLGGFGSVQAQARWQSCLPNEVKAGEVLSRPIEPHGRPIRPVTVQDKLNGLGARCRRGRLVDSRGKEIRFYTLAGCWGNPPADYLEIMEKERQELARLKRRYRIVEIQCNREGAMIQ